MADQVATTVCPKCHIAPASSQSRSEKNPGKYFWRCGCKESCFKGWVDDGEPIYEAPKSGNGYGNKRRAFAEVSADQTEAARTRAALTDLDGRMMHFSKRLTDLEVRVGLLAAKEERQ